MVEVIGGDVVVLMCGTDLSGLFSATEGVLAVGGCVGGARWCYPLRRFLLLHMWWWLLVLCQCWCIRIRLEVF